MTSVMYIMQYKSCESKPCECKSVNIFGCGHMIVKTDTDREHSTDVCPYMHTFTQAHIPHFSALSYPTHFLLRNTAAKLTFDLLTWHYGIGDRCIS